MEDKEVTLTPHSVLCGDCGGWESVKIDIIGPNSQLITCGTCNGVVASLRGQHEEK